MNVRISEDEIINALEKENTLVLATCAGSRVTIRPMSHINSGLSVYFQTSSKSLKMRQISKNPYIAMCLGTYEIEGRAEAAGHPFAKKNAFFAEKYKAKHPGAFSRYSPLEDEVVIKVDIIKVRQWRYVDGEPVLGKQSFFEGEWIR